MISFSIAYIFLCMVIVIGVIFLVRGLFMKSHHRSYPDRDDDLPIVPDRFDVPFIERQIIKIQNSPNMVENYITCLRARYTLAKEAQVINQLGENYLAKARMVRSKKELLAAAREFRVAELELGTAEEEAEVLSTERRVKIAEARKKIRDLEHPEKPKPAWKSYADKYEDKLRAQAEINRIKRAVEQEEKRDELRDKFSHRRAVIKVFEEERLKIVQDVLQGKDESEATEEELEEIRRRQEDLDDLLQKMLAG